jgi:hypothetical protein
VFIWASETYHDKFWYPVKGSKIADEWKRTSPWGQLFEQYPG